MTSWAFTCFTEPETFELKESGTVLRAVYQLETCPTTQKSHIQGFVQFKKTMTMAKVKAFLGNDVHVEQTKGTPQQNYAYCTKAGGRNQRVIGNWTWKGQGKRSDLDSVKDAILAGISEKELSTNYFGQWVRYNQSFTKFRNLHTDKNQRDLYVTLLVGPAGSGKTRTVYESHPIDDIYSLMKFDNPVWFDGYTGQDVLLLDDYRGEMPTSFLLKLLDRYPLQLNIKGGTTWAKWTHIYITTNQGDWETDWVDHHSREALKRRINSVQKLVMK